jgi:hypothetical protein
MATAQVHSSSSASSTAAVPAAGSSGEAPVLLLDVLSRHAVQQPTKNAWTFLSDSGDVVESYTYWVSETTKIIYCGVIGIIVCVTAGT